MAPALHAAALLPQILEWDSLHFGFPVARLDGGRLDGGSARVVLEWCKANRVRCLYFLADPGDPETHRAAFASGFRMVDVRIDFAAPPGSERPVEGIRTAERGDLEALEELAASAFRSSRFYFDGRFVEERCDELFRTWVRRGLLEGFADTVLAACEPGGRPIGFCTCSASPGSEGRMGLIAVSPGARGRGIGSALIGSAMGWFGRKGATEVRVATQIRNTAAMNLYAGQGFRVREVGVWYHRWFGNGDG